jgi:hypothetical protein
MSTDPTYYNVSVVNGYNTSFTLTPSDIEELNNDTIITNGRAKWISIARFSIPTNSIPRLIVPVKLGQSDPNLTLYQVIFKLCTAQGTFNEAYTVTFNVPFITQHPLIIPQPPLVKQDLSTSYYFVYDIEMVLLMFNNALKTAFSQFCQNTNPVYKPDYYPFITFDNSTKLFSINLCASVDGMVYFDQNTGTYPYVTLSLNHIAYNLFQFTTLDFSTITQPSDYYTCVCFNKFDNSINYNNETYYKMTAPLSSLNIWCAFQKIIIAVNYGISTKLEYDSSPNIETVYMNNSTNISKPMTPILTDFEVNKDEFAINNNWIQFQTSNASQQRLVAITSDNIKNFSVSVYWVDSFGNRRTLGLTVGLALTIKFAFYDKNMKLLN